MIVNIKIVLKSTGVNMIPLIAKHCLMKLKWHRSPFSRRLFKSFFIRLQLATNRKIAPKKMVFSNLLHSTENHLNQKGFCFIPQESLTDEMLDSHTNVIHEALEIANSTDLVNPSLTKKYLHRADLTCVSAQKIKTLYDYVTNEFFLNIASQYFGEKPLLVELKVLVSPPSSESNLKGSQLWHSDFSDTKLLKIFIFIEDVDSNSGPLEIICKEETNGLLSTYDYRWGVIGFSHNDSIAPDNSQKIHTMTGDKGSIVLVDTVACLHRGSRNCTKTRKILYATYSSRTSFRHPPWNWLGFSSRPQPYSSPLLEIDPNLDFINEIAINR